MKYTVYLTSGGHKDDSEFIVFETDNLEEAKKEYAYHKMCIERDKRKDDCHIVETEAWESGNYNFLED